MSNTTISMSDILERVAEMDMEELREAYDMLNARKDQITRNKKREFSVGDTVRVRNLRKTNEWAGVHEGKITKINRKTANVTFPHPITGRPSPWKVYLAGLERVD